MQKCSTCGQVFDQDDAHSPACGPEGGITVTPDPARGRVTVNPASIIQSGIDPDTGDLSFAVSDPAGVHSESRMTEDGRVTLVVQGSAGVGTSDENRAVNTLRQRLEARGLDVAIQDGIDERGEDSILQSAENQFPVALRTPQVAIRVPNRAVGGDQLVDQIRVPPVPEFVEDSARDSLVGLGHSLLPGGC